MRKLVDPLYLLDAKCRPLSSYDAMEARIKLLEHQLARMVRLLRGQKLRNEPDLDHQEQRTLN
jgi:hypothetical protein